MGKQCDDEMEVKGFLRTRQTNKGSRCPMNADKSQRWEITRRAARIHVEESRQEMFW